MPRCSQRDIHRKHSPSHSLKTTTYRHVGIPLSGILLFAIALTGGCTTASTEPTPPIASTPVETENPQFQEELRRLDAFLDANTNRTLEIKLRQNIARLDDAAFQQETSEWKQLMLERPALPGALKTEQRFLLHRALARMSGHLSLERRNLRRLDEFLDVHPAIQNALEVNPALLTSLDFQIKYPPLAEFFASHPDLYSVFYQNAGKRPAL